MRKEWERESEREIEGERERPKESRGKMKNENAEKYETVVAKRLDSSASTSAATVERHNFGIKLATCEPRLRPGPVRSSVRFTVKVNR